MKRIIKFIESENVYLRPFSSELDAEICQVGKNDESLRETLFYFSPFTKDQTVSEIERIISQKDNELLTICEQESDLPIGQTGFYRIDLISRAAVFYIGIYDTAFHSKGYGFEATKLMLKYAFDTLNLNRVQLHVAVENLYAINVYKKSGFTIEGTLREAMYHNNRYIDFYVMGILRSEYYG